MLGCSRIKIELMKLKNLREQSRGQHGLFSYGQFCSTNSKTRLPIKNRTPAAGPSIRIVLTVPEVSKASECQGA